MREHARSGAKGRELGTRGWRGGRVDIVTAVEEFPFLSLFVIGAIDELIEHVIVPFSLRLVYYT